MKTIKGIDRIIHDTSLTLDEKGFRIVKILERHKEFPVYLLNQFRRTWSNKGFSLAVEKMYTLANKNSIVIEGNRDIS